MSAPVSKPADLPPITMPSSMPPATIQDEDTTANSPRFCIPIYNTTRWELYSDNPHSRRWEVYTDHLVRLTSNVKGVHRFWILNMKSLEKTKKFVNYIIQDPRVKVHRPPINMSMDLKFLPQGYTGSITYKFASPSNRETFKTFCEASRVLNEAGFVEDLEAAEKDESKTTITYKSNKTEELGRLSARFTEITHKLNSTFYSSDATGSQDLERAASASSEAESTAQKIMEFCIENSCIVGSGVLSAPSPFPGASPTSKV